MLSKNDGASVDNPSMVSSLLHLLSGNRRVVHVINHVLSNPLLPGPHPLSPQLYLMARKLR